MPTLRPVFILLFIIQVAIGHVLPRPSYGSSTPTTRNIHDNKTIIDADYLVCPLDASSAPYHTHDGNPSTNQYLRPSDPILTSSITSFKSFTKATLESTTRYLYNGLNTAKNKVLKLDYALYVKQSKDFICRNSDGLVRSYALPLTYRIRRTMWPLLYGLNDMKDDLMQLASDIYVDPGLEWHILTTKMTGYWMNFCRHLGIDTFIRHTHQQMMKRLSPSSAAKAAENTPPFSHLDDLFKTMLETDHHGKFYRQQMAQYYQWLSPKDQASVLYSKREFIRWAKDSASKTHELVIRTQQDWIQLMQSLYHDMETMLDCLSLPPPTDFVTMTNCSPKHRRQAMILLSPTITPAENSKGSHTKTEHARNRKSSSSKKQRYQWMFELEQIHRELKTTINCICPQQLGNDGHVANNSHNHRQRKRNQQHVLIEGSSPHKGNQEQQHENEPTANLESVDMLAGLKKSMKRRYARLDKDLHRQFFAATPPHGHYPMHYIYERLRENVSAVNRSTYDKYLVELILSWTRMMANTLDMANTVADDMSWLLRKQQENQITTSTSLTTNGQETGMPHRNNHADDKNALIYQQYADSMELIWTSAQRKMERNNQQLINQWELIFTDMDQELQGAWMDMLDMVEETHQSSFERVKNFWYYNKARLSTFFSSLFQHDYSSSVNIVD